METTSESARIAQFAEITAPQPAPSPCPVQQISESEKEYVQAVGEAADSLHHVGGMPHVAGLLAVQEACPLREEVRPEGEPAYEVLSIPSPEGEALPSLVLEEVEDPVNLHRAERALSEKLSGEDDLSEWEIVAVIPE